MKVLLDTHCWLWWLSEPKKLSETAHDILVDQSCELYLSVASIWEIGIKVASGKLSIPQTPEKLVSRQMAEDNLIAIDIKSIHAIRSPALPMLHRDPFDRMLIAQSQVEQLPILTTDSIFSDYEVQVIW